MSIAPSDFEFVRELVRRKAAIILEPGKEYLVEARLGPLVETSGFPTLAALLATARANSSHTIVDKIVDALTTNETSFFRDFHPFESLRREILPKLIELRRPFRKITLWSAACSTGQEAYSLAMLLTEHFPELASWNVEIIGTDLSPTVLARAKAGRFSQLEVNRGLPAPYLIKYFTKEGDAWVIKDHLRRLTNFRPLNFIETWPLMPAFDLIFLRNVLIYFDVETKRSILKRVRACLLPHGTLFLGAAETTLNLDPGWTPTKYLNATVFHPIKTTAEARPA